MFCTHSAFTHPPPSLFYRFLSNPFFSFDAKKKRAFKHVKRSAFQIRLGTKKAAFPPLCAFAVTWNAPMLLFIYLFYNNIRKSLPFRDSPGLSRFIPAYPVQYPFMTCILPLY
ncbi:MAG: hypothetical protein ACI4MU_12050, partial [Candidatus Ventricola sp.]